VNYECAGTVEFLMDMDSGEFYFIEVNPRVQVEHTIRLDGGTAYSGAVITRFYDSLLTKVTARAPTPEMAIARMDRALREFRIRGVSTNIAFVENLLKHPTFLNNEYHTKFIDETPGLFDFKKRRDRATKILTYVADITVNGHPETAGRAKPAADIKQPRPPVKPTTDVPNGTRNILDAKGPEGIANWMRDQSQLLITDTTMRDGHQSLLATRMRSIDMINVAPAYATKMNNLFSVECWGGATQVICLIPTAPNTTSNTMSAWPKSWRQQARMCLALKTWQAC